MKKKWMKQNPKKKHHKVRKPNKKKDHSKLLSVQLNSKKTKRKMKMIQYGMVMTIKRIHLRQVILISLLLKKLDL